MPVDSSKSTFGDMYRWINSKLNTRLTSADMTAGETGPHYSTDGFIDDVNDIAAELGIDTEYLERYYVVRADVGLMRYIKYTRVEGDGGILRIDLNGQTATLPSGTDDFDCLGAQYEKICDGDGVDFVYEGTATPSSAPDSFPKIYLPAESDIEEADLLNSNPLVYNPLARIKSSSGADNQPIINNILDVEYVGFGSSDTTDDNYPTTGNESTFFIDPFVIAAMELLTVTYAGGAVAGANLTPRSADAYLNDTWLTISGSSGAFVSVVLTDAVTPLNTFAVDGVTYTVAPVAATGAGDFDIEITSAGNTWTYEMISTQRPWQTVVSGSGATPAGRHRWGAMFDSTQDKAWYLKFDAQRIKLPDDVEKIEWVMKIPKHSFRENIQVDSDDANVFESLGDNITALFNPIDHVNHYYPVTETLFTRAKPFRGGQIRIEGIGFDLGNLRNRFAGLYMQKGQQIYIEPKTTDPILIAARCKPDLADNTTTIANFDSIRLEIPSLAVNCIKYRMLSDYYISKAGDIGASQLWMGRFKEAVEELKALYKGKMGQSDDGAPIQNKLANRRRGRSFGYNIIPDPGRGYQD